MPNQGSKNPRVYSGSIKKILTGFLIVAIAFLSLVALLLTLARAEPTPNRRNNLGVVQTFDNPYTYLLALPVDGTQVEGGFVVRFWDFGMPELIDHSILFCDIGDKFDGKQGPLVIVYETQAHHMNHGIACKELKAVFEVKGD
jgi:uncharacterized membrane protein